MNIEAVIGKIDQEFERYVGIYKNYSERYKNDMLDNGEILVSYHLGFIDAYESLRYLIIEELNKELDKQQPEIEFHENCDYCGKSLVLNSGEDIYFGGWEKLCCLDCEEKYDLYNKWEIWREKYSLNQIKDSLYQHGITILSRLSTVKKYLQLTQNEMTIIDGIKCFENFDMFIKDIDLTATGRKLIKDIINDDKNPFQYSRSILDLICKVQYEYDYDINSVPLIELMFLVRFAHIYLGESQATSVCEIDEAVKWVNFNKKEVYVYRYVQDELYYDGFMFEGRFAGDRYKQASKLIQTGWAIEVRFLDGEHQVTFYKNFAKSASKEDSIIIRKNKCDNRDDSNYPQNYFAFRSFPELDVLQSIKDMESLTEIMDYMVSIPNVEIDDIPELESVSCDDEELPY
ncbi:alpha/beta hydrolase family protein [Calidifontibacillus oryziterrae]|uniref:hypothetical protein n=1 Tax=Calidifontibacillus oryziterrae TaxID=1191699 RepID=UPI0002F9F96E|nr:hypothetical protein [Calidifontibacillus oryziterrae]